ncbi:predicted protein [Botrytis cinerea T4]|uniref:Uncharacterized protein n=1 Tax=Botryotinia fuckeliana (strain T4) TaxID=999810 RepID=G2Y7H5_BOTF4|nr:predicted protein [Botrytis cinerea T4]
MSASDHLTCQNNLTSTGTLLFYGFPSTDMSLETPIEIGSEKTNFIFVVFIFFHSGYLTGEEVSQIP